MGILSLVSRLALKHCFSPPTPRSKGPRGRCLLQPCRKQDTQQVFPSGFPRKPASLELECRTWGRTAVPPAYPKSRGPGTSWKTEELCFSQGLGWPIFPPAKPHCPQRGFPWKMHLSPRMPLPQQIKPDTTGSFSTLRDAFFQGLLTHSATENQIF